MKLTRKSLARALIVAAIVTGVTFATAPAAAQSDTSPLDGILGDDDEAGPLESASSYGKSLWSAASGLQDRAGWWIANNAIPDVAANNVAWLDNDGPTASEEAASVTSYYNSHNATLEAYANDRGNWSSNETVEIVIHLDGTSETRFLLANASDGNLTSSRMVDSTERTPTHDLEVCGYAAEQAQEELERFTTTYAETGDAVTKSYLAKRSTKYGNDVETSIFPSSGSCGGDN